MIPVSDAIDIIKRETGRVGFETVDLRDSVGRILAEDIIADCDLPPFDRSQMDGFAVRSGDTLDCPVELQIVGESAAGHGWHHEMKAGEAVRIMTGAPVPSGADAVQKVELTEEAEGVVRILEPVAEGKNIVPPASETRRGDVVLTSGLALTANMIATPAAFGYATIKVATRPKVAVMSTGSEIVEIDQTPGLDQIRNSNSVMLKALADAAGCNATVFPIAGDDLETLKAGIAGAAASSDVLVITGGVSVGKYDLTKLALRELGAEIYFERVSLKPGKPAVFARLENTLVFGLPGNPVSAAVTFYLFVRQAVMQLQCAEDSGLRTGRAVLASDAKAARERDTYLPARLRTDEHGRLVATPSRWQGSSDFIGFAAAEALIFVPKAERIAAGSVAKILYL